MPLPLYRRLRLHFARQGLVEGIRQQQAVVRIVLEIALESVEPGFGRGRGGARHDNAQASPAGGTSARRLVPRFQRFFHIARPACLASELRRAGAKQIRHPPDVFP